MLQSSCYQTFQLFENLAVGYFPASKVPEKLGSFSQNVQYYNVTNRLYFDWRKTHVLAKTDAFPLFTPLSACDWQIKRKKGQGNIQKLKVLVKIETYFIFEFALKK